MDEVRQIAPDWRSLDLTEGYDGWTAPEPQSDEELLEQYAKECGLATAAIGKMGLDAEPTWWFEDGGQRLVLDQPTRKPRS